VTVLRLRLFHAADGARIAYRESGTGPPLILAHSALLTHREFEPAVEHLVHRFRVVLPDLPLHGDSEDRPRHPYTMDWMADVLAAFCAEAGGARPLVGGHGLGAELLLHAVARGALRPAKLALLPNRLHRPAEPGALSTRWRLPSRAGAIPGVDRLMLHAARAAYRPALGGKLSARHEPAARDLMRHAFADVTGNPSLARSWARFARRWPAGARRELLDAYPSMDFPVLLLWADEDAVHPLQGAEEVLDLLPDAMLRVLPGTGFLIAYDDPVGVGRELVAFCG
jgi:pimeloyl-ACP methyl ester carboxylesterase